MGLTVADIRVGSKILPHGTAVTVAKSKDSWLITVIYGDSQGTMFKMKAKEASEAIQILV
jgi:hypothetical protein